MSLISLIDYKKKDKTKAYTFILLIFSESLLTNNQSVFEDLIIIKIIINKINNR